MPISKETIQRIREYYDPKPEEFVSGFSFDINGKRRIFSVTQTKEIFLGFGEKAETEAEAIEKGFIRISPREIFITLYPERWEEIKHKYHDERTEKYLQKVKENIGLIRIEHGYDEDEFEFYEKHRIFMNSSLVEIGKTVKGEWLAQFSIQTNIDDYDITRMYFESKPNAYKIKTANVIEDIRFYFSMGRYNRVYFDCWECGRRVHWLDRQEGNIADKWERLKDKYCGC